MRVQIWGRKRSSFPVELNLRLGCSTQLCLFSYQALSSGSKPASKRPMPLNPQLTHSLFLFLSLTFWLTPIFPLFIFLTLIDYPLPLAMPYLRSLSLSPPLLHFLQPSGSTECCGIRHGGLKVSIVTLCVLMSLVLTVCSQAKLSWHRGCLLFTPKLKPFTKRQQTQPV